MEDAEEGPREEEEDEGGGGGGIVGVSAEKPARNRGAVFWVLGEGREGTGINK